MVALDTDLRLFDVDAWDADAPTEQSCRPRDASASGWDPDSYGPQDQRRYSGSSKRACDVREMKRMQAARALAPPRPVIPADHVNVGDLWPGDVIFANGEELEVESLRRNWLAEAPERHVWHLTVKDHGTAKVGMSVDFKLVRRGPRPWDAA